MIKKSEWEELYSPPAPKLSFPTITDMFAYLLEVEGHRDIEPEGEPFILYYYCNVPLKGKGDPRRAACSSCVALRLYRYGKIGEVPDGK